MSRQTYVRIFGTGTSFTYDEETAEFQLLVFFSRSARQNSSWRLEETEKIQSCRRTLVRSTCGQKGRRRCHGLLHLACWLLSISKHCFLFILNFDTMRISSALVALISLCASNSNALSLNGKGMSLKDSQMLTQKHVTRMQTRRDTIMMPSQTPMVPWKVSMHVIFPTMRLHKISN